MRGCGCDRVEEGDCRTSFRSEVVVERLEKKEAEKSLKRKMNHYYALRTIIMYAHLFSKKFRVENKLKRNSALNLCCQLTIHSNASLAHEVNSPLPRRQLI